MNHLSHHLTAQAIRFMTATWGETLVDLKRKGYKVEFEERPVRGGTLYLIAKVSPRLDEEPRDAGGH